MALHQFCDADGHFVSKEAESVLPNAIGNQRKEVQGTNQGAKCSAWAAIPKRRRFHYARMFQSVLKAHGGA
jgi:hypothetical protein